MVSSNEKRVNREISQRDLEAFLDELYLALRPGSSMQRWRYTSTTGQMEILRVAVKSLYQEIEKWKGCSDALMRQNMDLRQLHFEKKA